MKTTIICILLAILYSVDCAAQQDSAYQLRKVLIDAGHGGKDPGAIGKVSKEKNLTLAIAKKLGHYIDSLIPGVEVVYTRETDKFLSLKERAEMTNNIMPDVFISVHINSCKNSKAKGFSTYVNGTGKDKDQIEVQKKENGGEEISAEDIIIMKNIQAANHTNSALLAQKIQDQFRDRAGRLDLGVKEATFAVLWRAYMPAVLVECGYISNRDEEKYLNSEYGQSIVASAIFRAFRDYKNAVESRGNTPVQTQPAAEPKTTASTKTEPKSASTKTEPKKETKPAAKTETQKGIQNTPPSGAAAAKTTPDNKIYFRVQIKSSPKKIPLNSKEFKGLKNVDEIKIDGVYKYTVGKTQNYSEITKILKETKTKFKDAFPIATKGNTRIEITEAKKALKQ
ncbi:MAG: N-acetylmuramoyl-L-alanine amidase [Bacteroidales bacterium]|nr:N-acetylmuramoyl-L-alanine amidase [Bacteroidales bacterium]